MEQQLKEIEDPTIATAEKAKQKQSPATMQAKSRLKADQSVFEVYKGVKCFHFSKEKNMIVTGGKQNLISHICIKLISGQVSFKLILFFFWEAYSGLFSLLLFYLI